MMKIGQFCCDGGCGHCRSTYPCRGSNERVSKSHVHYLCLMRNTAVMPRQKDTTGFSPMQCNMLTHIIFTSRMAILIPINSVFQSFYRVYKEGENSKAYWTGGRGTDKYGMCQHDTVYSTYVCPQVNSWSESQYVHSHILWPIVEVWTRASKTWHPLVLEHLLYPL